MMNYDDISGRPWPFEHTCVINLNTRPDRWARIDAHLKSLGVVVQRYPAVSFDQLGSDLPSAELESFLQEVDGHRANARHKALATWACMRSHLAIIAKAKAEGWPQVLILEDDCRFERYSLNVLRRVQKQLDCYAWDLLYLGGTLKKGGVHRRISSNLQSSTRVRLAHAYVVRASIYDRILDEAPQAGLPIDWYYSERLLPSIAGLVVVPRLADQQVGDLSDIEQVARKSKIKTRQAMERWWSTLRYRDWTW